MTKAYFDHKFLGGAWVKGICCKCGKRLDGYHVWQFRDKNNNDYCEHCRPVNACRVNF